MTTNNQLDVGLKGSTGSGSFVGTTSPTFTTPTLGAVTATSINFGQTTLSTYATGSWTPTDASGAGLSFSTASGIYTRIGNFVVCSCIVVYPSTANTSNAKIGGLPFNCPANDDKTGGVVCYSSAPSGLVTALDGIVSTATFSLLKNTSPAPATNANCSTGTFLLQIMFTLQ